MVSLYAQSAIYYPNIKALKPSTETGLYEPESFVLLLDYTKGESAYKVKDIDLLDSVYRVAFSRTNPMMYTIVIEGYGSTEEQDLVKDRVNLVHRYFTGRCDAQFMIRIAPNPISSSCYGDSVEIVISSMSKCPASIESRMSWSSMSPVLSFAIISACVMFSASIS